MAGRVQYRRRRGRPFDGSRYPGNAARRPIDNRVHDSTEMNFPEEKGMKTFELKQICALVILLVGSLTLTGCGDDFYLSEKEVAAYNSIFASEATLNQHFDKLQGRAINLTFDNSTVTPRVQSTNLLAEMRLTELAQLETGPAAVSLARLSAELESQIGAWIEGRLQLY